MIKVCLAYIVAVLFICAAINNSAEKKVDAEYSLGKKAGYAAGYAEVENFYKQKLKEQTSAYKKKVSAQEKTYEKKIEVANKEGFSNGKKEKQKNVEDNLKKASSDKEKKGKWNDVLFNVNE